MLIAGVDVELRAVTVLSTSAAVKADDELPEWAPLAGKMSASFDAAHFEKAARVRIDITATGDDGMCAVRAELLCEFAVPNDCLLYTSPSPRDLSTSRMPSSA